MKTTPTLEDIRINPEILDVMVARAHAARSAAMNNAALALVRGIRRLLSPKPGVGKLITRMG